jgi:YesN/AraC family two-component response regulator
MNDYISKPINISDLETVLHKGKELILIFNLDKW